MVETFKAEALTRQDMVETGAEALTRQDMVDTLLLTCHHLMMVVLSTLDYTTTTTTTGLFMTIQLPKVWTNVTKYYNISTLSALTLKQMCKMLGYPDIVFVLKLHNSDVVYKWLLSSVCYHGY